MKVIQICVVVTTRSELSGGFRHVKVIQICVVVTTRSDLSGGFQICEGGHTDLCSDYYQVRVL